MFRRRSAVTGAVVLVLTLTLCLLDWHGLDYPAQIYRVGLVRRQGFSLWDANWYGGHYTPAYGIIVPWVASVVGLPATAVVSTLGSVVLFERLLTDARLPHVVTGTVAFTLMMLVNMYEGRIPFAFGVLLGLLTMTLARRGRWRLAAGATVLTTLASPVAGAFVALAFGAWAMSLPHGSRRDLVRTPQGGLSVVALLSTTGMSLAFPEGGYFPYNVADMLIAVGAAAVVWWTLPHSLSTIRWAFLLAGLLALPLFVIPNPMGGNLSRLAVIGAPLLCAVPRRRLLVHAAVCLILLGQQAKPLLELPEAVADPTSKHSYYQPLVNELKDRTSGPVRLEIPNTESHWEAAYVARDFPLARGWERQLDLRYNALLYDAMMTSDQYHGWLVENGVSYVAIPDADLESEALHEVEIARNAPYLRQMWRNEHWQLFRVVDSPSLVTGPARVVKMAADLVRLDVFRSDPVILRMRYASHLMVVRGRGCITQGEDGWTELLPLTTGRMTLRMRLLPTHLDYCSP
ncbi:MAG: hypothetical protein H0T17_02880 [Propionibacteriales bacterium]|nr:hypothetical protein [Propionibacteriales bacterium]